MPETATTLVAELVRKTGQARIRAMGTSMVPTIWPGDELLIQNAAGPLRRGQVVAWQNDQRIFIHRVVEATDDQGTTLTRGDRLHVDDPLFRPEQLIGVVTHVIRDEVATAIAPGLSQRARLLRLISRVSDWPAFLLIRLRGGLRVLRAGT